MPITTVTCLNLELVLSVTDRPVLRTILLGVVYQPKLISLSGMSKLMPQSLRLILGTLGSRERDPMNRIEDAEPMASRNPATLGRADMDRVLYTQQSCRNLNSLYVDHFRGGLGASNLGQRFLLNADVQTKPKTFSKHKRL